MMIMMSDDDNDDDDNDDDDDDNDNKHVNITQEQHVNSPILHHNHGDPVLRVNTVSNQISEMHKQSYQKVLKK